MAQKLINHSLCGLRLLRKERILNKNKKQRAGIIKVYYCDTHRLELCRCGLEWGRHEEYYILKNKEK